MATESTSLDRDTEHALAHEWLEHGRPQARDRLHRALQPLVRRLAHRYRCAGCSAADLMQEGNLGLLHAIDRFDPERGTRLATYATWWIRAHMLRFVEHNSRLVRGTTTSDRLRLFYRLTDAKQQLAAEGKEITSEAIADLLGVAEPDVIAMEMLRAPVASLDAPTLGLDSDGPRGLDRLADDGETPEDWVGTEEFRTELDRALDRFGRTLSGRTLEMFRERVASPRPASLHELSARWGVTRAAARRIEQRVSRPLRRYLYQEMGDTICAALGGA
jgi:RNA polymerase sigma-32 factor